MGMKLVPVSNADQLKYGINFLALGKKKILAIDGVSSDYKQRLAAEGVNAVWMDFSNLTGGYGAAHCTTQVLRRD
jgi:arginine deiminase